MYQHLRTRIEQAETLLLDGAVGTQLQRLGVPMDNTAWAATAPAELPSLFDDSIDAGVQVVGGCCGIDAEYYAGLKSRLK